jgi:hypothetical protein
MSKVLVQITTAVSDAVRHVVELPITFGQGSGSTQIVSREEMEFTTSARLAAGDRIAGYVRFPGDGLPDTILHYAAVVVLTRRRSEAGALLVVVARFERLQLTSDG